MLIEMRYQNWDASFSYAPPLLPVVINTDHVLIAKACESRGAGPWMKVTMQGGDSMIVKGVPSDLIYRKEVFSDAGK